MVAAMGFDIPMFSHGAWLGEWWGRVIRTRRWRFGQVWWDWEGEKRGKGGKVLVDA